VAALRVAEAMAAIDDVTLLGVAGRHRRPPVDPWLPSIAVSHLPIGGPLLYDAWLRGNWPKVERATGPVDVAHATTLIPCATDSPMVVTLHDLAFLHDPSHFTRRGNAVFRRSLDRIRRRADLVLCSSQATMDDCLVTGIKPDRMRLVPLGVDAERVDAAEVARVSTLYGLPERYLLFVGTVEPRKNLVGLSRAVAMLDESMPLVVAGVDGWGDVTAATEGVQPAEAFCYPSEREGYGLPVLEAMAQGTPVVTSRGTATEETAAGAAVLVDPLDPTDIARGISEATARRDELSAAGLVRAGESSWEHTAQLTAAAYRELCR
jgi:glycosyltransferase involved in cell wall biosynthesis